MPHNTDLNVTSRRERAHRLRNMNQPLAALMQWAELLEHPDLSSVVLREAARGVRGCVMRLYERDTQERRHELGKR